jgi:phosphoribosylglycinamide formyltransferase-1
MRLCVLISGYGANLQALIDAVQGGTLPPTLVGVISNRPDAYGLVRAKEAGIPAVVCDHTAFSTRQAFEEALLEHVQQWKPDYVVLAGFMRVLSPFFISHFPHQMLNIHPALLPKHPGLHTHAAVLRDHDTHHGCSIHVVTDTLDGGPLVAQASLMVHPHDTEDTLSQRVLELETKLYPWVLTQLALGHLSLSPLQYQGKPIPPSGLLIENFV